MPVMSDGRARPRVSFLGIGVQKCATSWLHGVVSAHPQIGTPRQKETDFFIARHERGYDWYERQFARGAAVGEFSPNYFTSEDAVARAHGYNPELRLIAVLRDPVERAFSNHLHELRKGHVPAGTSFEAGMAANPAYVAQGRYGLHLRRWIARFGAERVLILLSEEIAADPARAYAAVCAHLGVDAAITPEGLGARRHESVGARSRRLQRTLRSGGDTLRRLGLGDLVPRLRSAPGLRQILEGNRLDLRRVVAPMREETRAALGALFAPDMIWVRDQLGRDLPWASFAPHAEKDLRHVV